MLKLAFNGGEISPFGRVRCDLDVYQRGLLQCWNFLPDAFGGVRRRPGCEFLAEGMRNASRLVSWSVDTGVAFMLELAPYRMRVWRVDERPEMVKELAVVWGSVRELRTVQVNDVMYVAHPDYAVQVVEWHGGDDWRVKEMVFTNPPQESVSLKEFKVTVGGCDGGTRRVALTVPEAFFTAEMVGTPFRVTRRMDTVNFEYGVDTGLFQAANLTGQSYNVGDRVAFASGGWVYVYTCRAVWMGAVDATQGGDPARYPLFWAYGASVEVKDGWTLFAPYAYVQGGWNLRISGTWEGEWQLWRKPFGEAGYVYVRSFASDADNLQTFSYDGRDDEGAYYSLRLCKYKAGRLATPVLRADGFNYDYQGSIEAVADGMHATLVLSQGIMANKNGLWSGFSSDDWSSGAFGGKAAFPCAIAFYQGRLWFGGTRTRPTTLWASKVDDYTDFALGDKDDDGLMVTLQAKDRNGIVWMSGQMGLLVGTRDGEWLVEGGNEKPVSPTSVRAQRVSAAGADGVPFVESLAGVVYVQYGGRRVREFGYVSDVNGYVPKDVTVLAEHVAGQSRLVDLALQVRPESRVWAVREDGVVCVMTLDALQNVYAWSRHRVAYGRVRAVAVARMGAEDEVWVVVEDGLGGRSLQRFREGRDVFLDGWRVVDVPEDGRFFYGEGWDGFEVDVLSYVSGDYYGVVEGGGRFPQGVAGADGDPDLPGSWPEHLGNPAALNGEGVPPWGNFTRRTVQVAGGGVLSGLPSGHGLMGVRFVSSMVSLPLDTVESAGRVKGCRSCKLMVFATVNDGVSVSGNGHDWLGLDVGVSPWRTGGWRREMALTGWYVSPVAGDWQEEAVVGVRVDGLHQAHVLGAMVNFNN